MTNRSQRTRGIRMLRRWLILVQIVLICVAVWELWSVMSCPQPRTFCPNCSVNNRYPAGCGWACIPVNPKGSYHCCCPGVWSGGPGGAVQDCCHATCFYYDCSPIIPGFSCPPYDLDFTPSHCTGLPYCNITGPYPLQGLCSATPPGGGGSGP